MKSKLETLLRKVFLSSLGGIIASTTNASIVEPLLLEDSNDPKVFVSEPFKLKSKLILKLVSGSEWKFANHRSHRSHSSHRSHYSSRTSTPSSGNSNNTQSETQTFIPKPFSPSYQLGSRILKLGMKGSDVTQLINILLAKQYLTSEDGRTEFTGEYLFDDVIESAVKRFQKDNELTDDGIVSTTTVYYLKNK